MKINHIITRAFSLIIVIALCAGCEKDLGYVPESYLSPEQVYTDESGSEAGITGIYRQLQQLKRSEHGLFGNIGTDEGTVSSFVSGWGGYWLQLSAVNSYDPAQLTSQNEPVFYYWQRCYLGIANANTAIRFLHNANISDPVKNRLLGEAKFLRSVFYFYLVQFFGPVPMPTEVPVPEYDKDGYPRSPVEDVYNLIEQDLQFAIDHLNSKSGMGAGRANKEAARALLGKVYLTRKNFAAAQTTLEPLMNTNEVALLPNYADLFDEDNENNRESLFEIQYSSESGYTQNVSEMLGSWALGGNVPGGGGQVALATDYAANIFPEEDSIRKEASLRSVYYDPNTGEPGYLNWWADVGKPHIKKFEQRPNQQSNVATKNIGYLRYADAILMYAEALNELGSTAEAINQVNRIRTRAQVTPFADLSQQQLRDSIVVERIKELMFEGWRWFDLKRWGLLVPRTNAYNAAASGKITEPKNLVLPIPFREFANNRSLTAADQNPGY